MTLPAAGFAFPLESAPSSPPDRAVRRLSRPRATLLASLGLGLGAEVLFDGHALGVSFPLFAVLLVGALLALGGREGWQRARPNAWLLVPGLFFAAMVFVRDSALLTALNGVASGLLVLLVAQFWAAGRVERLGLGDYAPTLLGSFWSALCLLPAVVRVEAAHLPVRGLLPKWMPVLRGAALALPVLLLFTGLLASADAVFDAALSWGVSAFGRLFSVAALEGGLFAAGSALGVLGLLAHALRRRREREAGEREAAPAVARLGFIECLTLVGLVDALFLVFASLQLAFLWGGARLPVGVSHSEYARRGFFELLVVSVLTLGLSLALERWTRLEGAGQRSAFRGACSAMVGLVLVLLVSAVKRMALYEAEYGYTELRLYTHVFMVALAGVLGWRGVTLWWRPERFALGAFVGALLGLVALNVLNPDAFIARDALARSARGQQWDPTYLNALSADAAPELAAAQGLTSREPARDRLQPCHERPPGGWPSFHLARHRAAQLLPACHLPGPGAERAALTPP